MYTWSITSYVMEIYIHTIILCISFTTKGTGWEVFANFVTFPLEDSPIIGFPSTRIYVPFLWICFKWELTFINVIVILMTMLPFPSVLLLIVWLHGYRCHFVWFRAKVKSGRESRPVVFFSLSNLYPATAETEADGIYTPVLSRLSFYPMVNGCPRVNIKLVGKIEFVVFIFRLTRH